MDRGEILEKNKAKNRRTLKGRIRWITFLCILITLVFFSSIVIYIGSAFFKVNTSMISSYFSNYIAQSMTSNQFAAEMGINSLSELKPGNEKLKEWLDEIKSNSSSQAPTNGSNNMVIGLGPHLKQPGNETAPEPPPSVLFDGGDFINLDISVNNVTIYSDKDSAKNNTVAFINKITEDPAASSYIKHMLSVFNTDQITEIQDARSSALLRVYARLNDGYIILIGLLFSGGILLAAILAVIAGLVLTKIFTIPVAKPLCKLDEKIKAIAEGGNDTAMTSQIELKKPLREIESLAESTNSIMVKMREINELLIAQNEELEAQNEELFNSKKQVEQTQTMLVQSENMASIGQLTAAITHEINTPLGAINSNAQIFDMLLNTLIGMDPVNGDEELKGVIQQMKEANDISIMACSRVSQIIRSLKSFSKIDQAEFQEADINEGIRSVLVLTSNLWKRKITIHEEYGELPRVMCYSGMLNQVFMNIVVNAIQAIEDKGDLFIKTWADGGFVNVSIRDTGCGIKEENLRRIFDNGFTTKGSSLGMGLGLSISKNIIEKHNGDITVNSRPGESTEFVVTIPIK